MHWLDYRLQDFLLFAPDTYWRLFELANQPVWPFPLVFPLLLGACIAACRNSHRIVAHLVVCLFAVTWVWCGGVFVGQWYASINGLVSYAVPLFYLQALLILWSGLVRNSFRELAIRDVRGVTGAALIWCALLLYPTAGLFRGQGLIGGEFVGAAPDPTAVATLGLGLMMKGSPAALCLPIPLLVCAASCLTLWGLGSWQAWIPLAAVVATVVALWTSSRVPPAEQRSIL